MSNRFAAGARSFGGYDFRSCRQIFPANAPLNRPRHPALPFCTAVPQRRQRGD